MTTRARYDLVALAIGLAMGLLSMAVPPVSELMRPSGRDAAEEALQALIASSVSGWCVARALQRPISSASTRLSVALSFPATVGGGALFMCLWFALRLVWGERDFESVPEALEFLALVPILSLFGLLFVPVGWLGILMLRAAARD